MKGVVFNREACIQGLSHKQTFAGIIRHLWTYVSCSEQFPYFSFCVFFVDGGSLSCSATRSHQ